MEYAHPFLTEFQETLDAYEPSPETLSYFSRKKIGVLVGPTGSGKDTLRDALVADYSDSYIKVLSDTTRPPRPGERDGFDYNFRRPEQMLEGFQKGEYLQGTIVHQQQVSGIHARELGFKDSQMGLAILVVGTERQMHGLHPGMRSLFLVPPTADLLLERMQIGRNMDKAEVERRLLAAKEEIAQAITIDEYYFVITNELSETLPLADAFFRYGKKDRDGQARIQAKTVLDRLLSANLAELL